MVVALTKAFGVVGPNTTTTGLALSSGAAPAVPLGDLVVVAALRSVVGTPVGVNTLVDSDSNTYVVNRANSVRASASDLSLHYTKITNALEASDPLTITFRASSNRLLAAAAAFSGLTGDLDAASSNTVVDGATSVGFHGSANPVSASITVAPGALVVAAVAMGAAGNTFTPTAAQNWIATPLMGTAFGSSERNVQLFWKISAAGGATPFGGNLGTSGTWVAAMMSFIPTPAAPGGGGGSVVVGGAKKTVATRSVVVGGVKKPVVASWVVVGGVKKALV